MRHFIIIAISIFTLSACSSKKAALDEDTLPKDIALKPDNNFSQADDQQQMKNLVKQIDSLISTETCTNAADWKFTAIGAKPCGGPSSYIAYPEKLEEEVLSKITRLTSMQSAFNTKYNLTSDCAMVMPPVEIRCENGKAVLIAERLEKEGAE